MSKIILTDENFKKEALDSKGVLLIDFYADWCGPCRALTPILDEIAKVYENRGVRFGTLDVDKNTQTSAQFNIMSIPNILIFQDGQVVKQMVGLQDKGIIEKEIDRFLA